MAKRTTTKTERQQAFDRAVAHYLKQAPTYKGPSIYGTITFCVNGKAVDTAAEPTPDEEKRQWATDQARAWQRNRDTYDARKRHGHCPKCSGGPKAKAPRRRWTTFDDLGTSRGYLETWCKHCGYGWAEPGADEP